jgi:hypothetical protein
MLVVEYSFQVLHKIMFSCTPVVRSWLAMCLAGVLALPAHAQQPPSAPLSEPSPATSALPELKVLVLQGAGVTNNIRSGAVTSPVIEIRDENDRPVEGAEVIFRLPASGPGGVFADQRPTFRTRTNSQGQAGAPRFSPSPEPGSFQIVVTATFENRVGRAVVQQTNSVDRFSDDTPRVRRSRKWLFVSLAAAATTGVVLALVLRGGGDSSPMFTLTPGPISIGPPR